MMQDHDLDDLFAQAQADVPQPSADLLARVMADATAALPRIAPPLPAKTPRTGFFAALLARVGGAGALAGLATATLAGVWLGFAQPGPVLSLSEGVLLLSEGVLGEETLDQVELFASYDHIFTEG